MNILQLIIAVLTGLSAAIPLAVKLVQTVKEMVRQKNWSAMMTLVLKLMSEAEENYQTGAEKKKYVIDSIKAIEGAVAFDIDEAVIAGMIDAVVEATKKINK